MCGKMYVLCKNTDIVHVWGSWSSSAASAGTNYAYHLYNSYQMQVQRNTVYSKIEHPNPIRCSTYPEGLSREKNKLEE